MNGQRSLREFVLSHAAAFSVMLVSLVFVVDAILPLGVASAVPYTFAVLLALKARSPRFGVWVAVVCCVLTFVKMGLFPERGTTELWKVITNRCLAVFAIGMSALLGVQRRRAEDQRQRAEAQTRLHLADLAHLGRLKTAGQLATSLAHELNQPLAAVSLQSEIATQLVQQNGAESRDALLSSLREITEQSQRAGVIVRSLREQVRKPEPVRATVALNNVVHDAVRLIEAQAERAGVTIRSKLSEPLPPILGDSIQLEQVLLNLMQNAIEAVTADESGPRVVQVETRCDDALQITISVSDTGVGFAPGEAERVFERFHSTKPHGMGMGLAISRSIVEDHGGRLCCSSNPDRGATFTLTLPVFRSSPL
ncbi:MAG: GHKL domain-containing protein [Planctomycetaceae bacterium]|nr:GHKL domain-containing protein [Planctomycetaceae bacterium]